MSPQPFINALCDPNRLFNAPCANRLSNALCDPNCLSSALCDPNRLFNAPCYPNRLFNLCFDPVIPTSYPTLVPTGLRLRRPSDTDPFYRASHEDIVRAEDYRLTPVFKVLSKWLRSLFLCQLCEFVYS